MEVLACLLKKRPLIIFGIRVQGDLTPDVLDPRTLGKNYFGMSYPGPKNPKKYNGKDDYTYLPNDIAEYPAILHDLRYDALGIRGANGLLQNKKAIPVDDEFIRSQMIIGNMSTNPLVRLRAYSLGYGLGALSLPTRITIPYHIGG